MTTFQKNLFATFLSTVMAVSFVACGGGNGGTTNDTVTPDVANDVPVAKKNFTGILIDFQTRKALAGAQVYVLDEATGKETGQIITSSGADTPADLTDDGVVAAEFDASLDKVGFLVKLDGQRDTYQLHYAADGQNETLWSVSKGTYVAAPALAGISIDETKGILAGGLYFVNAQGEEEGVGCAKIRMLDEADVEGFATANIRYMNAAGLPTTLAKQDGINPQVPFFIVGNIPENKDAQGNDLPVTVTAQMDGTPIGDTYVFSKAGAIFIGNIFTYTAATAPNGVAPVTVNPQPAGCGQ